jgi:hypothetical protein
MDKKLWVFENLRRSMGRASMCWSQPARVDYIKTKRWAARIRNFYQKLFEGFLSNLLNLAPTLGRMKSSIIHGA